MESREKWRHYVELLGSNINIAILWFKKEKQVKSYTRKSKSGKQVQVKSYSAKYNSAEDMVKEALKQKKGAGKELLEAKKIRK